MKFAQSMRKFTITAPARADIKEALRKSFERHGEYVQASYENLITVVFTAPQRHRRTSWISRIITAGWIGLSNVSLAYGEAWISKDGTQNQESITCLFLWSHSGWNHRSCSHSWYARFYPAFAIGIRLRLLKSRYNESHDSDSSHSLITPCLDYCHQSISARSSLSTTWEEYFSSFELHIGSIQLRGMAKAGKQRCETYDRWRSIYFSIDLNLYPLGISAINSTR